MSQVFYKETGEVGVVVYIDDDKYFVTLHKEDLVSVELISSVQVLKFLDAAKISRMHKTAQDIVNMAQSNPGQDVSVTLDALEDIISQFSKIENAMDDIESAHDNALETVRDGLSEVKKLQSMLEEK